jgi:hypothetical protein
MVSISTQEEKKKLSMIPLADSKMTNQLCSDLHLIRRVVTIQKYNIMHGYTNFKSNQKSFWVDFLLKITQP